MNMLLCSMIILTIELCKFCINVCIIIQLTDTLTSSYDGIIHKVHYGVNDVAKVGSPLVDIDIESTEEAGRIYM